MSDKNVLFIGGPWHGDSAVVSGSVRQVDAPLSPPTAVMESIPAYAPLPRLTYRPSGWQRADIELWTVEGVEPWMAVRR